MNTTKTIFLCVGIFLCILACKEQYESPVKSPPTGYLVVEGILNSGGGSTTITLSRTTSLDNRTIQYEDGAQVSVEGEDNSSSQLFGVGEGKYIAGSLPLSKTTRYRLKIITSANKEYVSDFTRVRNNPPIDSISWKRENKGVEVNGVQLYINTHDPEDSTRYYQWEYTETWEYHAYYPSHIEYLVHNLPRDVKKYEVVYRDPANENVLDSSMYFCWRSNQSGAILLGSSAKLARDLIYLPLLYISPNSEKLSELYSVQVRQYSWSKEGYEFLERMKKNTEQTGSVFDPQPSALNGNIHCVTDPNEPVIGYVSICPVQETRFFMKRNQVPDWKYLPDFCTLDTIDNNSDSIIAFGLDRIPVNALPCAFGACTSIVEFVAAAPSCVDCTLHGGTNVKPPFWPW